MCTKLSHDSASKQVEGVAEGNVEALRTGCTGLSIFSVHNSPALTIHQIMEGGQLHCSNSLRSNSLSPQMQLDINSSPLKFKVVTTGCPNRPSMNSAIPTVTCFSVPTTHTCWPHDTSAKDNFHFFFFGASQQVCGSCLSR